MLSSLRVLSGPKWWHRRPRTPPQDTTNVPVHPDDFFSEKNPTSWATLTLKWAGKAEPSPHHKPQAQHDATQAARSCQLQGSPWKTVWTPRLAPQLLGLRDGPLKHLTLRANRACIHETRRRRLTKKWRVSSPRGLSSSWAFPRKGLFAYVKTCCLGVQLLHLAHL